jgi:predicted dehydrogenase
VVISGAGAGIFSSHRRGLAAVGAEVVAAQDNDPARVEQAGAELACSAYTDLGRMLAEVPADLAVVLAPHPHHCPIAVECLRSGLHVLVEKPVAVTVGEGDLMVAEAERAGRLLAVGFQRRSSPEVRAARRLVAGGGLGRLQRADVLATWTRRTSYFAQGSWRGTWRGEGGGVLINQGQHDLDLLCLLAGLPARVVAWTGNRAHRTETEDSVLALAEWPGGATGSIRMSTAEVDEPRRIELTGTAGRLRLAPGRLEHWRHHVDFDRYAADLEADPYEQPASDHEVVALEDAVDEHVALYRNLVAAIAGREPLLAAAASALAPLELANALSSAAATGGEVRLPIDRAAYAALLEERRAGVPT